MLYMWDWTGPWVLRWVGLCTWETDLGYKTGFVRVWARHGDREQSSQPA